MAPMVVSRTFRTHGLVLVEHELEVPLDHARPNGEHIALFAREVADPDGTDRPYLVFLNGGPGHEAPRPTRGPTTPGWLDRALRDFRVILLDQRGTGRSTPVSGPGRRAPEAFAEYLAHFRADAIVRDCELLREALGSPPWTVLGQSFGGFCTLHYLSAAPDGLATALFTGGLPPIGRPVDDVYAATFRRTLERNRRYYERYPGDRARVRALHERLAAEDLRLPDGDRLTGRRLRQLGNDLGWSNGAELLHYVLELPPHSPAFLHAAGAPMSFARNPLYAVLHESSYADGGVTGWSAERVMPAEYAERPELFTGEHVFPWMFEDYSALAPYRETAELLARREWPRLFDAEVLRGNEVPAAAAVYAEDLFVEAEFSMETAATVRGLRPWLTNEHEHNGLRADGARILDRLLDLARGRA